MSFLLAVDLGLRTGFSLYGQDGRLVWYRSQNFASVKKLKSAVYGVMNDPPAISHMIIEGGGQLAQPWIREAQRRQVIVSQISAETWRKKFLFQRHQRTGLQAKHNACVMARKVIEWSGAKRPTSLRHDAAEAILTGLWGVLDIGWLKELPAEIK